MKKGKVILGAAAMIITAAGAFAFKSASNATNRHTLFGSYKTSIQLRTFCTKVACWTIASGTSSTAACLTKASGLISVRATYTQKTTNGKCKNVWTGKKTITAQ